MTTLLEFLAVAGIGLIAGSCMHEASHWVAAEMFGARPLFDVFDWSVRYDTREISRLEEAVILTAPYVYGVSILATALLYTPETLWNVTTVAFFVGLFTPSEDDFLLSESRQSSGSSTSS